MARTFEMGGKSYNTLTAIAKELGVKRVYTRDFAKYGITETTVADAASKSVNIAPDASPTTVTTDNAVDVSAQDDDAEDNGSDANNTPSDDQNDSADVVADDQDTKVVDNPLNTGGSAIIFAHATADGIAVDKVVDINPQPQTADDAQTDEPEQSDDAVTGEDAVEVKDDAAVEDTPTADDAVQNDTADADAPAQVPPVAQPQTEAEKIAQIEKDVVDYADADELGKAVRKISLQGLITMVTNIQGDTWERISNEGIRKMRLIMELKKGYFPTAQTTKSTTSSGPSPWKKISTADLKAAATAKDQTWKDCSNEGILRMRLIMVLKAAGVTADELKK